MSFDDAVQALEGAIETDNAPTPLPMPTPQPSEQATPSTTPEGPEVVQPHHASNQPRDPQTGKFIRPDGTLSDTPDPTQVADTPDLFTGEQVNPDQLIAQHPELAPFVKQLQGAFTRKTQELAEQRRQFDGIDPAMAREAVDLYQSLQDPDYLVQFHSELTNALEAQGLSRAAAHQEAARMTEAAATQPSGGVIDKLAALRDDPELAPVADTLAALEQQNSSLEERLARFEQDAQMREQQEAIRMRQMAMAAELQRQELAIRASNPHYKGPEDVAEGEFNDLDAIHALSAFFDGNLIAAQNEYERIGSALVSRYLAQKGAVETTPGVQTVPGTSTSEVPTTPQTLDEAQRAAEAYLVGAGLETLDL